MDVSKESHRLPYLSCVALAGPFLISVLTQVDCDVFNGTLTCISPALLQSD